MRSRTAGLSTPPRKSDTENTSREPLAPVRNKSQLRKAPMDAKEVTIVSEIRDQQPNSDNGMGHTLKQREDPYQSAYETGLATGSEAGYRRGYQDGFIDACKLANSVGAAAPTSGTVTGEAKKAGEHRAVRLRGLPCGNCGCFLYCDEAKCPSCGTPKPTAVENSAEPSYRQDVADLSSEQSVQDKREQDEGLLRIVEDRPAPKEFSGGRVPLTKAAKAQ
jgi:hypothetical protein